MNTITWSRSILNHVVSLVWLGLFGVIVAGCQSATASPPHRHRPRLIRRRSKRAYKGASPRPDLPTGGKIAWVIEQALEWARNTGAIEPSDPGTIVAWSLGAEGLWSILNNPSVTSRLGIHAAASYYPANDDAKPIISTIPLLLLTGEADDVTPAADIKEQVRRGNSTLVELLTFEGAHHGFDIASIHPSRTVRLLPFVGPKGTFGYDEQAATRAWERLIAFLETNVPTKP